MWRHFRRFRNRVSEEELREEFDSHLAHQIDEHVERGASPHEARYMAVRQFGNLTRHLERFREALVDSFTALESAAAAYQPEYLTLVVPRPLGLQSPRYTTIEARDRLWRELDAALGTVL
jgi:hypothetical protein